MTPDPTALHYSRTTVAPALIEKGVAEVRRATLPSGEVVDIPYGHAGAVSFEVWEPHIRIPARLTPMPGSRLDLVELEDWIVAAYAVMAYKVRRGDSPTLSFLAQFSGRSEKRVKASLERCVDRGWVGMAKVRNEFAPGQFGMRWRIWFPEASPVRQLMEARPGGDKFAWIAVPQRIARYRSVLATAMYLVCHEQRRIDGAIVTTPSDVAALLSCDRNTARRLLALVGASAVDATRPGHALYDMPILYERRVGAHVLIGGVSVALHGNTEQRMARLRMLQGALVRAGIDAAYVVDATARELQARTTGVVRFELLVRVVEERHVRELSRDDAYRARLAMRLGWRMRGGLKRLSRLERKVAAIPASDAAQAVMREEIRSALAEACTTCDGAPLVEHDDGQWGPCPSCRPPG